MAEANHHPSRGPIECRQRSGDGACPAGEGPRPAQRFVGSGEADRALARVARHRLAYAGAPPSPGNHMRIAIEDRQRGPAGLASAASENERAASVHARAGRRR
jgi:hypothetical protein